MFNAFGSEARYYEPFHRTKLYCAEAVELAQRYPETQTVLEIGSGTGLLTRRLLTNGWIVDALEPSAAMREVMAGKELGVRKLYDVPLQAFRPERAYDLVVAHYDVLNYIPFRDIGPVMKTLRDCSLHQDVEIWDAAQGVRFWDYRRAHVPRRFWPSETLHRLRLGVQVGRRAFTLFIHWGDGLTVNLHRLYLHEARDVETN